VLGEATQSAEPLAPDAPRSRTSSALPLSGVTLLFLASGACGLVDQICFSKYLNYVMGATAYAVSTVLAAFMAGLALGAHLGGRFAGKLKSPLRAYGILELAVALSVAVLPWAFRGLTPLYVAVSHALPGSLAVLTLVRWVCAALLVVVPTAAMGATLPILTELTRREFKADAGRVLGRFYAANTCGGAIGALAAAYWILPTLGLSGTLYASAVVSALVGVLALVLAPKADRDEIGAESARESVPASDPVVSSSALPTDLRGLWLFVLALFSGWLVFAAEVIFTHLLAVVIGNSVYAFGIILTTFLGCLFVGASLAGLATRRLGEAALPLALILSALAILGVLPFWDDLPHLLEDRGELLATFALRELARALLSFAILCVPTALMGLTFPLLLQRASSTEHAARSVGHLTTVNTLGAVLGALSTGYLLLPWLGSELAVKTLALTFALLGVGTLLLRQTRSSLGIRVFVLGGAVVSAAGCGFTPRWDFSRLTAGNNVYFDKWTKPDTVLFAREDVHGGITTVTRKDDVLTLYTNGKFQGNTGWEMSAQRMFAHYPSLFVSRFERSLVIGLGTATTLGTLTQYPWRHIDVVEISPAIVDAARTHFSSVNLSGLEDPRVRLSINDGRNFLLVRPTNDAERYDMISMELSSIWFAGAATLYADEFYALVKNHLARGGVFQQWVQLHHVERTSFASILYTLRRHFEHVALFVGGGQGIIVASNQPLRASEARLRELTPRLSRVLEKRSLADLTNDVVVMDASLDAFLAESAHMAGEPVESLLSTDDNLRLEYATPRGNVLPWSSREKLIGELHHFSNRAEIDALLTP
jgi:spermidine synthase